MNGFCTFCKIVNGELNSNKVYETDDVIAFLDIRPINLGHTLLISKKHYEDIHHLPEKELMYLSLSLKIVSDAIKKAINADGINILMNNGRAAGQIIGHAHYHVIPRFVGDGLRNWPGKLYSEGESKEVATKIKNVIS